MPAKKHICHASSIYREIQGITGKYRELLANMFYFDFEIVNFPFLDVDVPRSTSYGVYISQLIRFARASSHVADFNTAINC